MSFCQSIAAALGRSEEEAAEIIKTAPIFDKGYNKGIEEGFNAGWFAALDAMIKAASEKHEEQTRKTVAKAASRRVTLLEKYYKDWSRPFVKNLI